MSAEERTSAAPSEGLGVKHRLNNGRAGRPDRTFLIYRQLGLGGIETLIVRLANHLAAMGRKVTVCHEGGSSAAYLDPAVDQIVYRGTADLVRKFRGHASGAQTILLFSFDPVAAARAMMLEVRSAGGARITHLSGVYHPRAYFYPGERFYRRLADRWLAAAIGTPNLIFMNTPSRAAHADHWQWDLSNSPVIPLPIAGAAARWTGGSGHPLRLLSVGRLVDFKTYNLGMIDVIRECRQAGLDVCWDVFGTGALHEGMEAKVRELGLQHVIRLKGDLPYADFAGTVAGYDLFIGMGTAALEASAIGVPTILAVDFEERRSYGFLADVDGDTIGERLDHDPQHDFAALVRAYAELAPSERQDLSRRGREAVEPHSLPQYVERLDALYRAAQPGSGALRKRALATLHHWMTDAPVTAAVRRALRGRS